MDPQVSALNYTARSQSSHVSIVGLSDRRHRRLTCAGVNSIEASPLPNER
jgi:hypothetical protein